MPANELPVPGSPEYYQMIKEQIVQLSNAAGINITMDENGRAHMDDQQVFAKSVFNTSAVAEDPYAPKTWGAPAEEDFVCPSGQRCLIRRVDPLDLLGGGLLNGVDFITEVVQSEHIPNATKRGSQAQELAGAALTNLSESPERMAKFKSSVDSVVIHAVVKPEISPVPNEGFPRTNGVVYVDSISSTDKIAIFNYAVTGQRSEEIKQFRSDSDESVGTVESVADVRTTTVDLPSHPESS